MSTADKTVRTAGALRNNFLNSGLTLEGGPMDVLAQAFAKGRTDIGRIEANANAASKNKVSAARTKMLTSMAGSAAGAFGGDALSSAGDVGAGLTSVGNGTGFDLGYSASQSFRDFGGGFSPGEFV